jgi:type IV secretion system protein VirD4
MNDWFKSGFKRFGAVPPAGIDPRLGQSPPRGLDRGSQELLEEALPRGLPFGREQQNRSERAEWAGVEEIAGLKWKPGDIVLGKFNGERLGYMDDKPMATIASARSGKSSTVIIPTLLTYPGSALVLDPKGELAAETAEFRRRELKQDVHVLDPFGCTGLKGSSFNVLEELDPASPHLIDDVDKVSQSLVLREGKDAEADHWTGSGQFLLRGKVLYTLVLPPQDRHLGTVRELLTLSYPPLVHAAEQAAKAMPKGPASVGTAEIAQRTLFTAMAQAGSQFFGALTASGQSFLRKNERERSSIISTAETQTRFLDSPLLREMSKTSSFRLADLRHKNMTIYLCLPAGEMENHYRWLRLIVRQALTALEREGPYPRGKLPILFLMEEFASLGHMKIMEQAAAYFPGFGVKLWMVLQDLGQLKHHYPHSWQTMIGNTALVQYFATSDPETNDYISSRLGMTSFTLKARTVDDVEGEAAHKERLVYPQEIEKIFAARTGRQGLVIAGRAPVAALRLSHADVAEIKKRG